VVEGLRRRPSGPFRLLAAIRTVVWPLPRGWRSGEVGCWHAVRCLATSGYGVGRLRHQGERCVANLGALRGELGGDQHLSSTEGVSLAGSRIGGALIVASRGDCNRRSERAKRADPACVVPCQSPRFDTPVHLPKKPKLIPSPVSSGDEAGTSACDCSPGPCALGHRRTAFSGTQRLRRSRTRNGSRPVGPGRQAA
jgi:hypothetical protein